MAGDRLFRTIPKGTKREIPSKIVEVFDPLYVIEEKIGEHWVPTNAAFRDLKDCKEVFDGLDATDVRIAIYQRVGVDG